MPGYVMHRRVFDGESADDFSISDEAPVEATSVYFQMWRTRMDPYNRFREGALVYIADKGSRRIVWEARASKVLTDFTYRSRKHAQSALRSAYGLAAADLNGYDLKRSGDGWLLAWSPTVMRRLDIQLPDEFRFGRNGYRFISDDAMGRLGLPNPKPKRGKPLGSPPEWYDPEAARSGLIRKVPRYIPVQVRAAVVARDGGRCVGCGTTENLHLDHIEPWSKGGRSTISNLRLLCARSNLAKGAGIADGKPLCAAATG